MPRAYSHLCRKSDARDRNNYFWPAPTGVRTLPRTARIDKSLLFREVQHVRQWWIWGLLLVPSLAGWGVLVAALLGLGPPLGLGIIFAVALGVGVPLIGALIRLVVEVTPREVIVRYRPFWRTHIAVDSIEAAEPVIYRPIRDYLGWGIRMNIARPGRDIAYTISGDEGVRLTLRSGKSILLGSRRAAALAAAIDATRLATEPTA